MRFYACNANIQGWVLPACCKLSSSCRNLCEHQTCSNLIFADLPHVVETTCIKLVDKKSWQSTCIKPVENLQQTCYLQARASNANASWYRLDDSKATSLQQTCCNLSGSECVFKVKLWSSKGKHARPYHGCHLRFGPRFQSIPLIFCAKAKKRKHFCNDKRKIHFSVFLLVILQFFRDFLQLKTEFYGLFVFSFIFLFPRSWLLDQLFIFKTSCSICFLCFWNFFCQLSNVFFKLVYRFYVSYLCEGWKIGLNLAMEHCTGDFLVNLHAPTRTGNQNETSSSFPLYWPWQL